MSLDHSQADISALLCSRICHDLISPVGAIGNGVELMQEISPSMGEELSMIGESAGAAAATLQFYRIAFGAAPAGERTGLARIQRIVEGRFMRERADLRWRPVPPAADVSRATARLLLDLLLVAAGALPRGGEVEVDLRLDNTGVTALRVAAIGENLRLPDCAAGWIEGAPGAPDPAPGEVHYVAARQNADACGATLGFERVETGFVLSARIPSDA